ncbi:hypothetical protein [Pseudoglutamicibacter cumminsii]|uniref:hypothetical protein n=1 Tax=Pseudoglutamicibacter cumminsii TaxID=156979 RepID=UPI0021A36313|nr:hypothetical protein [Pseudoglutamicibacter cumminsii]MCT1686118.1 hypothetical protein [Pseudoglutamicibacter cumminsii]
MATPPEQPNPAKPEKASKPAKGPQQSKPSRTTRIRRAYKKLPQPLKIVLGGLGTLLMIGLLILGIRLVMLLLVVMLEIPWVASGVLLGLFLILLLPSNGWTNFGAYLFLIGAVVSAFLDVPGNPIYNAPFEKLFLTEGEYLSGSAVVEKPSQGETVISGENVIVDAEGNELRDINDFLTFLYRLALYSVIYGVLITLRGFLPTMKTTSTSAWPRKNRNGKNRLRTP